MKICSIGMEERKRGNHIRKVYRSFIVLLRLGADSFELADVLIVGSETRNNVMQPTPINVPLITLEGWRG